jgi:hypothetical protein
MSTKTALMAVALVGLTAGCASIMSGSNQEVTFNSSPDGATVAIDGRVIGKTPITTMLKKKSGQTLTFSKNDYMPLTMQLETQIDGWFWGNIVIGGLFGSTTDGLSGAVNEYSPNQYMVTLQPSGSTSLERNTSLSSDQKIKNFIIVGYNNIMTDLSQGKGNYLASLFDLLHIPSNKRAKAVKKLKALSEVYTSIPEFADHVIKIYSK